MNDICIEMRQRIESSFGFVLNPKEQDELERHCAQCEACRAYRELLAGDDSLLAEFAAPCGDSARRIREGARRRLRDAGAAPARDGAAGLPALRGSRFNGARSAIPRIAAIAAAAAAVVITLLVIDFIRGDRNGPAPAFASVQEKMQKCGNVEYRVRSWNRGEWTTHTEARTSSWFFRKDYGDSIIVGDLTGRNGFPTVRLYPAERRAVVSRFAHSASDRNSTRYKRDPVDRLAVWHKAKGFSFVRKERLNGVNAAVYGKGPDSGKRDAYTMTAWVDLETELPVRLEMVNPPNNFNSVNPFCGVHLSDFQLGSSRPASWVDVKPGEPNVIYDEFKWNFLPDSSYFSTIPPAGYSTVETLILPSRDSCKTNGEAAAEILVRALSKWLFISGNIFPDDAADLSDTTKVKTLLLAKYRRGGDPAEEFRAASKVAEVLVPNASAFYSHCLTQEQFEVRYFGRGAAFGDSKKIICLIKDKNEPPCPGRSGNGPYFSVYGDLHVVASPSPPTSVKE